jgi:RIO kinase 1
MDIILQLRKKTVKEQKAEKRKTKIKKHVKKRKEKLLQKKK